MSTKRKAATSSVTKDANDDSPAHKKQPSQVTDLCSNEEECIDEGATATELTEAAKEAGAKSKKYAAIAPMVAAW